MYLFFSNDDVVMMIIDYYLLCTSLDLVDSNSFRFSRKATAIFVVLSGVRENAWAQVRAAAINLFSCVTRFLTALRHENLENNVIRCKDKERAAQNIRCNSSVKSGSAV